MKKQGFTPPAPKLPAGRAVLYASFFRKRFTLPPQADSKALARGFTLIELLVVIAIIGLLSSIVLASLNSARAKARDARRKADLAELVKANELLFDATGAYAPSAGWFNNPNHGGLDAALTPTYIPKVPDDPLTSNGNNIYLYLRKDYVSDCFAGGQPGRYGFYARLENPSAADQATVSDSFDTCAQSKGVNYKAGN